MVDTSGAATQPLTKLRVPTSVSPQAQESLAMRPPRLQYPPRDDARAWLDQVEQANAMIAVELGVRMSALVRSDKAEVGGMPVYVLGLRDAAASEAGLVYLDIRGGALIAGGGELVGIMASGVASTTGITTCSVDYRMPPLNPYPAGLDDCNAVCRAPVEDHDPANVFVGSSSAGGNLAAALLLRANEGLPMPVGLVLSSPRWIRPSRATPSRSMRTPTTSRRVFAR